MKLTALSLTIFIFGLGAFFAYRAAAKNRDLEETLAWMDQTYNPHEGGDNFGRGHGWEIHYVRTPDRSEEVTQKYNQTFSYVRSCKMVIRNETVAEGIFVDTPSVATYTFNLRDIDPNSITLKTYDLHHAWGDCSDPETAKTNELTCDSAEIEFLTRNGATSMDVEAVETFTKLTGAEHESRSTAKKNKCWLTVDDVPYAQRLAKALKHAVELCGGKPSKF
jgi:hypothetical protein